jgi:hypothetical protein
MCKCDRPVLLINIYQMLTAISALRLESTISATPSGSHPEEPCRALGAPCRAGGAPCRALVAPCRALKVPSTAPAASSDHFGSGCARMHGASMGLRGNFPGLHDGLEVLVLHGRHACRDPVCMAPADCSMMPVRGKYVILSTISISTALRRIRSLVLCCPGPTMIYRSCLLVALVPTDPGAHVDLPGATAG